MNVGSFVLSKLGLVACFRGNVRRLQVRRAQDWLGRVVAFRVAYSKTVRQTTQISYYFCRPGY